jgi:hypothetical protein
MRAPRSLAKPSGSVPVVCAPAVDGIPPRAVLLRGSQEARGRRDSTIAYPVRSSFDPNAVALDGGLPVEAANRAFPHAQVFIAGRQHPPSRRSNRRLASYRAGSEGRISHLKRGYGLRR